jgi:hypothetical protein
METESKQRADRATSVPLSGGIAYPHLTCSAVASRLSESTTILRFGYIGRRGWQEPRSANVGGRAVESGADQFRSADREVMTERRALHSQKPHRGDYYDN